MNNAQLLEEIEKLKSQIDMLTQVATQTQKFKAVVEDVDDPDKLGRVRLRVAGIHPPSKKDLPTDQLPWQKVANSIGSGGGLGKSINVVVGQWVEVESVSPASSAWKVVAGLAAIPTEASGDEAFGNVAEGEEKVLSQDIIPKVATAETSKMSGTLQEEINAGLLRFATGGGGVNETPIIITKPFVITTEPIDWREDLTREISKFGAELGSITDFIKVDGLPPLISTIQIDLLDEPETGHPGNIIGYDYDGNKVYAKYENNNLIFPPLIPPGDYQLRYRVTEIGSDPINLSENTIDVRVVDLPTELPKPLPRIAESVTITDAIPDHNHIEYESTSDKAIYSKNVVDQGAKNAYMTEKDATPGNERVTINVKNQEGISRLAIGTGGNIVLNSAHDMFFVSNNHFQQYVRGVVEQTIGEYLSINAPTILLKGNIRIEGHMNINGNIEHTGNTSQTGDTTSTGTIHADTDVTSNVSLNTHYHKESGGTDDQLPTTGPF